MLYFEYVEGNVKIRKSRDIMYYEVLGINSPSEKKKYFLEDLDRHTTSFVRN